MKDKSIFFSKPFSSLVIGFFLGFIASLPFVHALDLPPMGIGYLFEGIKELLQQHSGILTFLAFFAILLAIYMVGLGRVPLFANNDRQRITIAVAMAIISSLGIYFVNDRSFEEMIILTQQYLGGFGILLFGIVIGYLFYHMFDELPNRWFQIGITLIAVGISLIIAGVLMP